MGIQSVRVGCEREDRAADSAPRKPARDQGALHQGIRSSSAGSDGTDASDLTGAGEESSDSPADELKACGKLMITRRGEVAEWLKAAVC